MSVTRPWTHAAALDAIALRRRGMTYGAIAIAVEHWHGFRPSEPAVRYLCRTAGLPGKHYATGTRGLNLQQQKATA